MGEALAESRPTGGVSTDASVVCRPDSSLLPFSAQMSGLSIDVRPGLTLRFYKPNLSFM